MSEQKKSKSKSKASNEEINLDLEKNILRDADLTKVTGGARGGARACECQTSIGTDSCPGLTENNTPRARRK